jgi:hypothetical protein
MLLIARNKKTSAKDNSEDLSIKTNASVVPLCYD